jgi:hypothetical protein
LLWKQRGQDREGQPQIVHLPLVDRPPVVGGVQEIGDPRRRVAPGDRRAGHTGKPQRPTRPGDRRRGARRLGGSVQQLLAREEPAPGQLGIEAVASERLMKGGHVLVSQGAGTPAADHLVPRRVRRR